MIHKLKLEHDFWLDVYSGRKTFELRMDDRDYRVGDYLLLCETIQGRMTGCQLLVRVVYKLDDYVGLQEGYCVLGIDNVPLVETRSILGEYYRMVYE